MRDSARAHLAGTGGSHERSPCLLPFREGPTDAPSIDWIVERELEELDPLSVPADQGLDGFLDGLCGMVELQIEPHAVRTRARYALFLELAGDLEIRERLQHGHRQFQQWTEQMLATLGIPDPVVTSRALMALLDGLLLHRLILDPDLDMRLAVERAVRALAEV